MAVDFPENAQEIVDRQKADVQNELPQSNPFLKNSLLSALVTSYAYRIFDVYKNIESFQPEFFPQTADGIYLDYWAELQNITQALPTAAQGGAVFSGSVAGTSIPAGNTLTNGNNTYTTLAEGTLAANTVTVAQITQSGGLATITFDNNHGLATGVTITISGADQSAYNGNKVVTVTNALQATFSVASTTTSPATGTIAADYNVITIQVQAVDNGADTNLSSGAKLSLQATIPNVNQDAYVDLGNLTGGADKETQENYRNRVIDAWQNPTANFNAEAIKRQALTVGGVTRVFVSRATQSTTGGNYNTDEAGFVTVYFVKDDDTSIIPSGSDISQVKSAIMEIAPMDKVEANIIVEAPVAVPVNVTFTSITPDTTTMRTAIEENIRQFFRGNNDMNGVEVGTEDNGTIALNALNLAIFQTVDTVTGQPLEAYTLSSPLADITVDDGKIATQGTVTFL
jgi:uncharacterized phage protein gp47/JayE